MAETRGVGHPKGREDGLCLIIGGVPLQLHFSQSPLLKRVHGRYAGFWGVSTATFPVFINCGTLPAPRDVCFTHSLHGASLQLTSGAAYLTAVALEQTLDSLLRILLSVLLVCRRGLLLHAATIVRNQRSYVFTGRSGIGKSTVARLSPPGTTLTDEVSLLRLEENCCHAYGTPFWGEFRAVGRNQKAPVAGIYVLVQGLENRLEKLLPNQKLAALLSNALFFARARPERQQLLSLLLELIQRVPLYQLQFRRDPTFWEVVA